MYFQSVFFVAILLIVSSSAAEWGYKADEKGPNNWPKISSTMCAGFVQSPINLDSSIAQYIGDLDTEVSINQTENFTETEKFTVMNNGHSLQIVLPTYKWSLTLSRNSPDRYRIIQIHFHWGSGLAGSEHKMGGKFYPLEMHIVSFDSHLYASPLKAENAPKGLAVVGVLFKLDNNSRDLDFLSDLSALTNALITPESTISINPFSFGRLLPKGSQHYYRYSGSLTTPPCTENVQWTVMRDVMSVSKKDLNALRKLNFPGNITMQDNFRPIQLLNPKGAAEPRVLYKSWSSSAIIQSSWVSLILLRTIQLTFGN